jgi:hypothetical protein
MTLLCKELVSINQCNFVLEKDGWESRWVRSDWKRSEGLAGSFKHKAGRWPGDPDDKGIVFSTFGHIGFDELHTHFAKYKAIRAQKRALWQEK